MEREIRSILEELDQMNDTYKKLEKIAIWEAENIENIYGAKHFSIGNYELYKSGFAIKIRAVNGPYNNDPKWITYYKVGACSELANLFSEIANRAGIPARVVDDHGIDHAWVEVKINNTWVIADPTVYWWYVNDRDNYSNWNEIWFNSSDWYSLVEGWSQGPFSLVFTTNPDGSKDVLTANYTEPYNVSINISAPDFTSKKLYLRVTTWKWSEEKSVFEKRVNASEMVNLTLGNRIYKFEIYSPKWYGVESYELRVYSIEDVNDPITLTIEKTRKTKEYFLLIGLIMGTILTFIGFFSWSYDK